jgi:hypothetical protein
MESVTLKGQKSVQSTLQIIEKALDNDSLSGELIAKVKETVGDQTIYLLVFEKYFFRASNRASLSVLLIGDHKQTTVRSIGSGGGQGLFFRFSFGAESSFAHQVTKVLTSHGFK